MTERRVEPCTRQWSASRASMPHDHNSGGGARDGTHGGGGVVTAGEVGLKNRVILG